MWVEPVANLGERRGGEGGLRRISVRINIDVGCETEPSKEHKEFC
jgi:hypothetical protein